MRLLAFITVSFWGFALFTDVGAESFDECPSSAYLIQGSNAQMYGVNLATGFYQGLSDDLGTTSKINAIGFNIHDQYIYGYGSGWRSLIRIDRHFQASPITTTNTPDTNFYVGDVSLTHNRYYAYRPGASYGLYYVDLDPNADAYLRYQRVVDGHTLNLAIYDFAFHPSQNALYSVDRNGFLTSIDPDTGDFTRINNVGESGTFGAVYFDSSEYFYISRNSDGYIFRIDLKAESPSAEFFAFGPHSNNNDGARCAISDIISEEDSVDFGNAPASYGSDIESNGARHEISDHLYLGSSIGGEDDGIEFVTNIEPGLNAVVVADVEGAGVINAWADWNQNGTFEESELFVDDKPASSGSNFILIEVPSNAIAGETWVRFRYSSLANIGANGGVSDGEVEDSLIDVVESGSSVMHYPSKKGFVTVAFEDNWPELGDYDMNDVVMALQTSQYSNSEQDVIRYEIHGQLLALGGGYHNGFAIQLDGISSASIDQSGSELFINGIKTEFVSLEDNAPFEDAVFIISNDLKSAVSVESGCTFYRTEMGCEQLETNTEFSFDLLVTLQVPIDISLAPKGVLNPFIFASPGLYHGDTFETAPGRSLEIHLKNKGVSARFNTDFWGLSEDRSNQSGLSFLTENGLPWALEIPGLWSHPVERRDLLQAYPKFQQFVESNAAASKDWYLNTSSNSEHIIDNNLE